MPMNERINVTKTILPERDELRRMLDEALDIHILTNNGPKCVEFEKRLANFLRLGTDNLTLCANGTLGLEIAIHAAGAAGRRIITTPFTYVATATAPFWVGCKVDFADIDPETLCISPQAVAARMRPDTAAVIPVNIYGHPCDDDTLRSICGERTLIYDAAQAFGATMNGRPLLDFGDFAVCSLHATKVMHSAEGGFVVSHSRQDRSSLFLLRAFGHIHDEYFTLGINAKMSELHACLGLALLDHYERHREARKKLTALYREFLDWTAMRQPYMPPGFESNYGYFPVIFRSESVVLKVLESLKSRNIYPRRYFYPALSSLPYLNPEGQRCPVAEDIARRVLCLPLYSELPESRVEEIASLVNKAVAG